MASREAERDLEAVYAELQEELDAIRPRCELSGRCCRFKQYGHQLWTTGIELQYLVDRHGLPEPDSEGVCPFLEDGLCSVRDHRMLGCRVFFCDEAYKPAMGPVYERYHRKIKALHGKHGIPYRLFEFLGEVDRLRQDASGDAPSI